MSRKNKDIRGKEIRKLIDKESCMKLASPIIIKI